METAQLFIGKYPQNFNDQLSALNLFDLYKLIAEPSNELILKIEQLQDAQILGAEAYRNLKSKLPYYIGVKYKNDIRKPDDFKQINWFTIDLDHLLIDLEDEEKFKNKFASDNRVALMFTSPGGQGLKLLFKLRNPICNTQQYSNFYASFTAEFARHYQIEDYLDFKTKDASRICFLSVDPKAYINNNFIEIESENYISKYDLFNQSSDSVERNQDQKQLTDDTYADILKKLNPKTPKKKKIYLVPEVLRSVVAPIENKARAMGIGILEKKDINYGQQITFCLKNTISIINLFYGKNGFTIHITNKGQSDEKFGEVCKLLIEDVLYQDEKYHYGINAQEEIVLKSKAKPSFLNN